MKWIHIVAGVLGVMVIGAFASLFAFTHVDRYYVSSTNTTHISSVTCAWAHWTGWHADEIAFCSDDTEKVVAWTAKANAALK